MMRPIRLTAVVICVAAIAFMSGGCGLFPKEEAQIAPPLVNVQKQTYDTAKVARGDIESDFMGSATLVSQSEYPMYFTNTGLRLKKIDAAVGDKVKKGQVLAETETGDLDNQITLEQYNVQLKQLEVQKANMGTDTIAQQEAQINLLIEQTKLAQLQQQKAGATIISPIDGQVTYVASVDPGNTINSYTTIVTVGDPNTLMADGTLPKADVSYVTLGMKCSLLSNGGGTYTGTVTGLPNTSSSSSSSSSTDQDGVMIKLDNPKIQASIGDVAQLKVITISKSNALIVPKNAVKQLGSSYVVDTWDGKTKKELYVQLGIQSDTQDEILSGVSEGQSVILN